MGAELHCIETGLSYPRLQDKIDGLRRQGTAV
jgi:hypothetical protein